MTDEDVELLCKEYFDKEGYTFPGDFEHRVDPVSSRVIYSFIRKEKPTSCLQIGCWEGGTTLVIMGALRKNEKPYTFIASELLKEKIELTKLHAMQKFQVEPTMIGDITKNLNKVPKELDFLFHDTDHDLETTQWVVDNIFPRIKKGALIVFHDWAVSDIDGLWVPKGGCWPETKLLCDMHNQGKLPFEKVYWNYRNGGWETGVFTFV